MKLATEVSVFIKLLRTTIVILAVGAVALFGRMAPAIEQILSDNVITLTATEDMLSALARVEKIHAADAEAFSSALRAAQANVTETGEAKLVSEVEARWSSLGTGSLDREALVEAIRGLARVNRASMEAADQEAERLGTAGAWSVVILSLSILAMTFLFESRLQAQVVDPLSAIEDVVDAAESGRSHRRCAERGPPEVRRIAAGLNRLLDLAASWRSSGPDRRPAGERALLAHLLDQREGDWVALDEHNRVLFASSGGWARIEGTETLGEGTPIYAEEVVVSDRLRLVRLDGEEAPLETVETENTEEDS